MLDDGLERLFILFRQPAAALLDVGSKAEVGSHVVCECCGLVGVLWWRGKLSSLQMRSRWLDAKRVVAPSRALRSNEKDMLGRRSAIPRKCAKFLLAPVGVGVGTI